MGSSESNGDNKDQAPGFPEHDYSVVNVLRSNVLTGRVIDPGQGPHLAVVTARAGQGDAHKTVRLHKAQPKGKGFLQVLSTSVSWAEVTVDGKRRGTTPTRKLELPEGTHRVVVRCVPDVCPTPRVLLEKTITVKAGETLKVIER